MEEPRTGWEKPSGREKIALVVLVFLLVGSACSNVVLREFWPDLAIESAIRVADTPGIYAGEDVDPWGRPWRRYDKGWYSWGPNGVDEVGEGDDRIVMDGPIVAAFITDEPLWHLSAWALALR